MREGRDQRDVVADGVNQGYAEAMVDSGSWKAIGGRLRRGWSTEATSPGLTGAALEAAVDALALRFPGNVETVH